MLTGFFSQYCILNHVCCNSFSLGQKLLVMLFGLVFKCFNSGINDTGPFTVAAYPALLFIPLIGFYDCFVEISTAFPSTVTRRNMGHLACLAFLLLRMRGRREKVCIWFMSLRE